MAGGGSWLPRGAPHFAARMHACLAARVPVITGHERHCPTPTPVSTSVARNVLARTMVLAAARHVLAAACWQQRAGSMYWQQRSAAMRLCLNCRVVAGIRSCNTRERECLQHSTALLEPIISVMLHTRVSVVYSGAMPDPSRWHRAGNKYRLRFQPYSPAKKMTCGGVFSSKRYAKRYRITLAAP
jgi:hypothetical protein